MKIKQISSHSYKCKKSKGGWWWWKRVCVCVCATWILQKSCDSFIRLLEYVECYHRRRMLYRTGYQSILTIFWLFTIKYTLYIRIWIRCTYVYSCNENNCVLALCDVIKQWFAFNSRVLICNIHYEVKQGERVEKKLEIVKIT